MSDKFAPIAKAEMLIRRPVAEVFEAKELGAGFGDGLVRIRGLGQGTSGFGSPPKVQEDEGLKQPCIANMPCVLALNQERQG